MKKLILFLSILLIPTITYASDITKDTVILINEQQNNKIIDNNENSYETINKGTKIKIKGTDIDGIYIIYELKSATGTISNDTKTIEIGKNNFLHEYIDINKQLKTSNELTITYNENVKIAEIYVLDKGELPDYIEVWEPPVNKADLLLFSTHSDDEQLFFLGLLPTYVAQEANVQVVYYTNHFDNPKRLHEQLHGLYTVGIRNYPIIGFIPDAWSENLNGAIQNLKNAGYTEDDAIQFQVEMIRRFKPLVIVGHDENGEYSHGQHILNTYGLKKALELANDKTYDEKSLNKYGSWDTPKTYLHLYKENQIKMNYDKPLKYFDGLTAYEVSKKGYAKHESQQWTWFTAWINGKNNEYKKATEITKYSPCEYGLYKTTVGEDIDKNDMFENLSFYKDQVPKKEENNKTQEKNIKNKNNKLKNKNDKLKIFNYSFYIIAVIIIIITIIVLFKPKKKRR